MSQDTFGTYRQAQLVVSFLLVLLSLNLPASLFYFIPKLGVETRRGMLSQTMILSLAGGTIAILVTIGLAGPLSRLWNNPALEAPLRACSLHGPALLILGLIAPFFISIDRAVRSGIYSILTIVLRAAPVVLLAAYGYSLTAIFMAMAVTLSIGALTIAGDSFRFCPGRGVPLDLTLIRSQLGYVLPLQAATAVGLLRRELDKVMIAQFFDPARYAVYVCGAIQIPVVAVVTKSMTNAIMPNLVSQGTRGDLRQALALWNEATRKCSLVIYPTFVACLICSQDLIALAYGPGYADAVWPFLVYLCGLPVQVAIYGAILRAFGRTKPIAVSTGFSLVVHLTVSLVLLKVGEGTMLAFVAPSIGTIVSTYASAIYMLVCIRRVTQVRIRHVMRWGELAWLLLLFLVCGAIAWSVPLSTLALPLRILARLMVYGAAALILLLVTRTLHDDEIGYLRSPLRWLGFYRPPPSDAHRSEDRHED